jgi:molybdenum cofactor biosynthesis enzyme MoaA
VSKIRLTGGEPFIRKDLMPFIRSLTALPGLEQVNITTNGVLTAPYIPELKKLGIRSINLSLDTVDRNRFFSITRRDEFPKVMETLEAILSHGIELKINAVVMKGRNIDDIIPLVELARELPLSVRFIEEMPFNGGKTHEVDHYWNHYEILKHISETYPSIVKVPDAPFSTSYNYAIPGFKGGVGIIAAYSRSFCGTCNRLRLTPEGGLRTCLYDGGSLNLRDLLRAGNTDTQIIDAIKNSVNHRAIDGWEAENRRSILNPIHESMATIGG